MNCESGNERYLESIERLIRDNLELCDFEDEFEEMKYLIVICKICRRLSDEAFERWRARVSEAASEEGGGG